MTTTALPNRYGTVAMSLHWLIAAAIIVNIVIVLLIDDLPRPEKMMWMGWHKSIGLSVLLLSIARVVWRLTHPVPALPPGLPAYQRIGGTALHHLFYLLIVAIPLAGWLMVSTNPFPTSFFGLFNWPAFPGLSGLTREAAHPFHETFETIHVLLGWSLVGLVPLHVAAGLYHHVVLKDNVLLRMLPGTKLRP
jgi:cytochrome b561